MDGRCGRVPGVVRKSYNLDIVESFIFDKFHYPIRGKRLYWNSSLFSYFGSIGALNENLALGKYF